MPRSAPRSFCSSCLTRPAEVSCALCVHDSPKSEDGFCNNAHCFRKHWDMQHAGDVHRSSDSSEDSYAGSTGRVVSTPIATPTTPPVVPVLWQDRSRSPLAIRRPEWDNASVAVVNVKQGYMSLGGQKPVLPSLDIRAKFSQHLVC
eukprot:jgi/Ulvmu1/7075/UM033_0136.1